MPSGLRGGRALKEGLADVMARTIFANFILHCNTI